MSVRYSIIVPVLDQWSLARRLLHCLDRQTCGHGEFELLLVDNGSRDFQPPDDLPDHARVLTCETPGSYAARNHGIDAARGTWLLFTDADCAPAADWIEQIGHAIDSAGAEPPILAGAIRVTAGEEGAPNPCQIYDMVKGIPQDWYVRRGYATTANLCVPRDIVEDIGPFDAQRFSGGDAEFCRRARARGHALRYLPEAVVEHPARDNWPALVTKARRIKGGQLTAGSPRQRFLHFARSFAPPLVAAWRFLGQRHQPRRFRVIAVLVQFRIWMVDMREALRLGLGMTPERR